MGRGRCNLLERKTLLRWNKKSPLNLFSSTSDLYVSRRSRGEIWAPNPSPKSSNWVKHLTCCCRRSVTCLQSWPLASWQFPGSERRQFCGGNIVRTGQKYLQHKTSSQSSAQSANQSWCEYIMKYRLYTGGWGQREINIKTLLAELSLIRSCITVESRN